MKTVVFAYQNIGCEGIEALIRNGYEISAVFTHKDDPNENIWFRSVAETAAIHGIPVFAPENVNHPMWIKRIKDLAPDVIFSFYYRNMISKEILDIPAEGCLNLHGSLLPKYRGRCPINWVLVNGEKQTGVTLHYMTAKPDDGDIVAQEKTAIADDDTAKTLNEKLAKLASALLDDTLPKIRKGTAKAKPQNGKDASYFGGRKPADGEIDWQKPAEQVRNLVRAVTRPYPGAFTFAGDRKCIFWAVTTVNTKAKVKPGTVISTSPLVIACGKGAVQVDFAQPEIGVYTSGNRMAIEMSLAAGMRFGPKASRHAEVARKKSVLIVGINGFIGNALGEKLLDSGKYEVHGMDLRSTYIERLLKRPGFHFEEGDISIHREWLEYHVRKCDIVLPLVAIATPIEYTRNPLKVFELDFEENLRIVRYCVKYKKRIIFPSTSEVYGMCEESEFDEDNSKLVLGPIRMQRWIYSCIKQLLDRVIWAYGQHEGLKFTLFRPFNWIGPRLDSLTSARIGSSRAITQLILNLVEGTPIQLIDGGNQKRCFTDLSDGIECLFRIIENKGGKCDGQIINIGNPGNEASIKELAEMIVAEFDKNPLRKKFPPFAGYREIESGSYYGAGYQDVQYRRPSIRNARKLLDWDPKIGMKKSVKETMAFFLNEAVKSGQFESSQTGQMQAGLRIDVDTYRGTRYGVPRLCDVLKKHSVKATFYFSVGPDNMGRHIWRLLHPTFFWKMLRTKAGSTYGWDIIFRGTFWPGPLIGRNLADIIRAAAKDGHEMGLHAWDHQKWQAKLDSMSGEDIAGELKKGFAELERILGQAPVCSATPAWMTNDLVMKEKRRFPFKHNSDCRGESIFLPAAGPGETSQPQIPNTLPTYDEIIGSGGVTNANYNEHMLSLFKPDRLNVLTVHAEVEGNKCSDMFDLFLSSAKALGIDFTPLGNLLETTPSPPAGKTQKKSIPGRDGWVATQEQL